MSNSHRMDNRDTNQMTVLTNVSGSYSKGTGFSWYDKYDENVYVTRRSRN